MGEVRFTIEGRLPGLNEFIKWSRTNKFQANNEKHDAEQIVKVSAWKHRGNMFRNPVEVYVTFYEPNDKRDPDNIIGGGLKPIMDALVLIGVLADDSRRHVKQIHPLVETDRDNPRIEVELREA